MRANTRDKDDITTRKLEILLSDHDLQRIGTVASANGLSRPEALRDLLPRPPHLRAAAAGAAEGGGRMIEYDDLDPRSEDEGDDPSENSFGERW